MNEKIQNTQNKLKELGYFSNENLSKLVYLKKLVRGIIKIFLHYC